MHTRVCLRPRRIKQLKLALPRWLLAGSLEELPVR